jgi:hypothetical protein
MQTQNQGPETDQNLQSREPQTDLTNRQQNVSTQHSQNEELETQEGDLHDEDSNLGDDTE